MTTLTEVLNAFHQNQSDFELYYDGGQRYIIKNRAYHIIQMDSLYHEPYVKNINETAKHQYAFYRAMSFDEAIEWMNFYNNLPHQIPFDTNPICLASCFLYPFNGVPENRSIYLKKDTVLVQFCALGFASEVFDPADQNKFLSLKAEGTADWSWTLGQHTQLGHNENKAIKQLIQNLPNIFMNYVRKDSGSMKIVAYHI